MQWDPLNSMVWADPAVWDSDSDNSCVRSSLDNAIKGSQCNPCVQSVLDSNLGSLSFSLALSLRDSLRESERETERERERENLGNLGHLAKDLRHDEARRKDAGLKRQDHQCQETPG